MYVPEDYEDYKYVVEFHDNYVILADISSVNGSFEQPRTVDVLYQYFTPSITSIVSEYTFRNSRQFTEIETGSSFYDRADAPQLMTCILFVIFFIVFILNGITKFVKKGGIFFG